ncbi:hypothetical protein [Streptomyces sp. NRRL F-5123]|uniref:hypothetical protein n=1 Tax=Streptomyces sp. NRRL F-5123 TaxID=1463856 RepID=UPI0004E17A06|nr:hypothetical protein [Streptomyces sp. NRRL F-5123]
MNDFAGVEPHRVRQLADRLQALATALARNGPVISKHFGTWGPALIDLGPLAAQTTQVAHDAHDMGRRADQAMNLLHSGSLPALCRPDGDFYGVPWDVTAIDAAKEARQEAAELKKVTAHPSDPASREIIDSVGQSLADHQDDPAYLQAFAANGGLDQAARVARVLHEQDGTHDGVVLDKKSEATLAQFGQGVQAATTMAAQGKITMPPGWEKQLTQPADGDMWSVGMLFKYGPPGDKWDAKVLSDVSGAMLDWRRTHPMRPGYSEPVYPYSAGGYVDPPDAWYTTLGIHCDYVNHGGDHAADLKGIRANDPTLALLDRLGENPEASRDLLGQDTAEARRHAGQLVDHTWQTPGPVTWDDSGPVNKVLIMAATDRSDAHADQSGQAAANILQAAARENDLFTHRNSAEKANYPTYPPQTAIALAGITGTWADDLGKTTQLSAGAHGYDAEFHHLVMYRDDVVGVMQLFARDNPGAAAMFDATTHQQVADAAAQPHPDAELTALGHMVGLFTKAKNGLSYTEAQQLDEKHKTNQAILDTVGIVFEGGSPPAALTGKSKTVVTKGLKYSQTLVKWGRGVGAKQTDPFSTDNAAKQEALNERNARDVTSPYAPAMAQGLIRAGAVPPPPADVTWYNPGTMTVAPSAYQDKNFFAWWVVQNDSPRGDGLSTAQEQKVFDEGYNKAEGSYDGK